MRLIQYLKDTKQEMRHVSWPTTKQTTAYTILVIIISAIVMAYLGLLDWLLTWVLDAFIIS